MYSLSFKCRSKNVTAMYNLPLRYMLTVFPVVATSYLLLFSHFVALGSEPISVGKVLAIAGIVALAELTTALVKIFVEVIY